MISDIIPTTTGGGSSGESPTSVIRSPSDTPPSPAIPDEPFGSIASPFTLQLSEIDGFTTPTKETEEEATKYHPTTPTTALHPSPFKNNPFPERVVYLIRHGQSKAQTITSTQLRRTDEQLRDCGLSLLGREQAIGLRQYFTERNIPVDWVWSSPLLRAIETAVLAFATQGCPVLCQYELRELGSPVPENQPRSTEHIWKDLEWIAKEQKTIADSHPMSASELTSSSPTTIPVIATSTATLDLLSLRPKEWPRHHDATPTVIRRDRIRNLFVALSQTWPIHVRNIVVVCHYHVIRTALSDPRNPRQEHWIRQNVHPKNAIPIPCMLTSEGKLQLIG